MGGGGLGIPGPGCFRPLFPSFSASAWGGDQGPLLENRLAKEELALAKTSNLYFVVRLKSKKIS